ncbi:zinc metallopeptidase [Acuticoccus sp. M5D2P5]|uniref:KPN_02809 family neutral zinc metallopeptidase n=1 Tax=Acuticoccus kalidii TaxID=2910977 RepID=UPI001F30EEEF|nr:neutral zinc metallopeptidase [Acuticoccus kalidii]MCF3936566.1 zinc metallopeptidase [Acuticoccus kalidii]
MRWEGRRRSDNIEDRRGQSFPRQARFPFPSGRGRTGGRIGGTSLVLIAIVALGLWVFAGINPLQFLDMMTGDDRGVVVDNRAPEGQRGANNAIDDQQEAFISVVLAETEDSWSEIFAANDLTYEDPILVLFTDRVGSACGLSSAAVGPFYCPNDRKLYLDMSFFDTLSSRFGAPGDFAEAYVLAHEVGHHVQNLTGVLGRYHRDRQSMSEQEANAESIKVELQADCYAGVWAHRADRSGIVEEGDIDEALGAAAAVGDDILQRRTQGYVVPESFNHGTAEQRTRWFRTGFRSGNPADCDTFSAANL